MCDPIALSAVGQGLSLMQKQQVADEQNAAARRQEAIVLKTTTDNYAQINRQGVEDAQNAAVETNKLRREMASRVASARVSAAGAGVSGMSVDALLLDLSGKGLDAITTSETNYARSVAARNDQITEVQNKATADMGNIKFASGVGAMDVAGAGLQVARTYTAQNDATQKAAAGGYGNLAAQRAAALERMGTAKP